MIYGVLSRHYDELVRFDYEGYYSFIKGFLPKGRGLDLACGTGVLTVLAANDGREMTGVDISSEMLTLAVERAKKARRKILFLNGDLNSLSIEKKYSFVISSCDGLNYASSIDNLKKLFAEVYGSLEKDGVFVFDVSTQKKAELLDGNVFFEDTDDYTLLWTNEKKGNSVDMAVTLFTLQKDGKYARDDENGTQYFYSETQIKSALEGVGFKVELFDGETYGNLTDKSDRLLAVAKK